MNPKAFRQLLLAFLLVPSFAIGQVISVTFTYTGAPEYWTVPSGVTTLSVTLTGGMGAGDTLGGHGAEVICDIAVTPGDILEINVGGNGVDTIGGYNGGGAGGGAIHDSLAGGGGGGASDIRIAPYALGDRIVVAGGGGGKGGGYDYISGGDSGCPDGENGENGFGPGGSGATASTAGVGGTPWGAGESGFDGMLGSGGDGGVDSCYNKAPGGGGGGGYYGGGGGATDCFDGPTASGGGGGGGSSLVPPGCTCEVAFGFVVGSITVDYEEAGSGNLAENQLDAQFNLNSNVAWLKTDGNFVYQVYDMNGREIENGQGIDETKFSIDDWKPGMYIVNVLGETGAWRTKIVR